MMLHNKYQPPIYALCFKRPCTFVQQCITYKPHLLAVTAADHNHSPVLLQKLHHHLTHTSSAQRPSTAADSELVDVSDESTSGNGVLYQCVKLLVSPDGKL